MKVLGICGSPRKQGNTDILLERALEGAASAGADTGKIVLDELDISPCGEEEYYKVNDEGFSVVDDDIHKVFRGIMAADALVLASPVFFGSLSAQTKTMIDRFQCVWLAKEILHKDVFVKRIKGSFICVEATDREDFFENSKSIVRHFFATANIAYAEDLLCGGVDAKGKVLDRPECLEKAFDMGRNLAETQSGDGEA